MDNYIGIFNIILSIFCKIGIFIFWHTYYSLSWLYSVPSNLAIFQDMENFQKIMKISIL